MNSDQNQVGHITHTLLDISETFFLALLQAPLGDRVPMQDRQDANEHAAMNAGVAVVIGLFHLTTMGLNPKGKLSRVDEKLLRLREKIENLISEFREKNLRLMVQTQNCRTPSQLKTDVEV